MRSHVPPSPTAHTLSGTPPYRDQSGSRNCSTVRPETIPVVVSHQSCAFTSASPL